MNEEETTGEAEETTAPVGEEEADENKDAGLKKRQELIEREENLVKEEELIAREEKLAERRKLAGKSEAGQTPVKKEVETSEDYAKRVINGEVKAK